MLLRTGKRNTAVRFIYTDPLTEDRQCAVQDTQRICSKLFKMRRKQFFNPQPLLDDFEMSS